MAAPLTECVVFNFNIKNIHFNSNPQDIKIILWSQRRHNRTNRGCVGRFWKGTVRKRKTIIHHFFSATAANTMEKLGFVL